MQMRPGGKSGQPGGGTRGWDEGVEWEGPAATGRRLGRSLNAPFSSTQDGT